MKTPQGMVAVTALVALACIAFASPSWSSPYFTAVPTSGPAPLSVLFTRAGITGTPDGVTWHFGDGDSARQVPFVPGPAGDTVRHVYKTVGFQAVTMTVWYTPNPDSTLTLTNYITVTEPDFTGVPLEGPAPLIVEFTSFTSATGRDSVTWDRVGRHRKGLADYDTIPAPGVYDVTMTTYHTLPSGPWSFTRTRPQYVTAAVDVAIRLPTAGTSDTIPSTVNFGAKIVPSTGSGGALDSIRWVFGDGDSVKAVPPFSGDSAFASRRYIIAGTYTVALRAWYNNGTSFSRTRSNYLTMIAPNFSATPTRGIAPLSVNFTAAAGWSGRDSVTWNFGDGARAGGLTPTHAYSAPGMYTVIMTAWYTPDPDFAVTKTGYIVVSAGGTFAGQSSEVAWFVPMLNQDSCNSWTYRDRMNNWLQMAGPVSKKRSGLTFAILNPTVDDTLKSLTVTSFIEKSYSVNHIWLYRDDGDSIFNAGDVALAHLTVSSAFQTNDQIAFTGLSNVIKADTPAYYHVLLDIDSSHVANDATYDGLGVTVHIKGNDMRTAIGGLGPSGSHPFGVIRNGCYPAKPNGYGTILEVQSSTCSCLCHHDPECDGVTDVFDVIAVIYRAFRGALPQTSPTCPREWTDVDCSGSTEIVDVVKVVNVAFRGGSPANNFCDPCAP